MSDSEPIRRGLYEVVANGDAEIIGEKDGEHAFRLTESGLERARTLIDSFIDNEVDPAAALALRLDFPLGIAEQIIARRKQERDEETTS